MSTTESKAAPGWYPDESGTTRWWDGSQWTPQTMDMPEPATLPPSLTPPAPPFAFAGDPAGAGATPAIKRSWYKRKIVILPAAALASILAFSGIVSANADKPADPAAVSQVAEDAAAEEVAMITLPTLTGTTIAEARAALDGLAVEATFPADAGDDWIVTSAAGEGQKVEEGYSLVITAEAPAPVYPSMEHENAVAEAKHYIDFMPFSRQGLIDQLSSEYGAGYPVDVATWAVDYLNADWNAEAAEAAKSYLDTMSFSRQNLYEQLTSQYGGQFTPEQAEFGLTAVGY